MTTRIQEEPTPNCDLGMPDLGDRATEQFEAYHNGMPYSKERKAAFIAYNQTAKDYNQRAGFPALILIY